MNRTVLRDDPEASIESHDGYSMLAFSCPVDGCYICIPITWGDVGEARSAVNRDLGARLDGKERPVWKATGTLETLTLHPSVHVQFGVTKLTTHWHGWVKNGVAQ